MSDEGAPAPAHVRLGAIARGSFPEPTERALALFAGTFALGVVSIGEPAWGDAVVALLALVVVGSVLDALLAGDPHAVRVVRSTKSTWRQGEPTTTTLTLTTPHTRVLDVTDTLPDDVHPRTFSARLVCAPGSTTTTHTARAFRRGPSRFGRVAIRTLGPLGLVRRRARLVVDTSVTVEADLVSVVRASARLRGASTSEGARRRVLPREGRELDALRDYARGDDVRLVEWKASAKRGALVVRSMRPESRQDVVLLVDGGRQLMGALTEKDGGAPRKDAAVTSALVLAASALELGDRVMALSFGERVRALAAARGGPGALHAVARALASDDARPEAPDYARIAAFVVERQPRRALVALFTDVTDEHAARAMVPCITRLAARHLPLIVAVGDPAWRRLSERSPDASVRIAAGRTLFHRRRALAALTRAGATVVDCDATDAVTRAHAAYLRVKREGRL